MEALIYFYVLCYAFDHFIGMKRPKGLFPRNFAGLKGKRILLSRTENSQIRSLVTQHTFETRVTMNLFCSERMVVVIVEEGSLQETERVSQF